MGLFDWLNSNSKKGEDSSNQAAQQPEVDSIKSMQTTISGPYCSGNLAVFLFHGETIGEHGEFITLEDALAKEKVVVKETGNVNQLQINNLGDQAVFVQSGDIVKGGKQDRALQFDMILDAKSGFIAINSFCVERGRWSKRGREDSGHFHGSSHNLSSKSLRMAAKYNANQNEVWDAVSAMQRKSALNAHVPLSGVQGESASSLDLTLEHEKIKECTESYLKDLSNLPDDHQDVVGYAFAINGQVNSADVYSNDKLFRQMWPKLIRAATVEAFSELQEGQEFAPPSIAAVQDCIDDAANAKAIELAVCGKSKTLLQESPKNVLFETRDLINGGKWVHRNYVTKS